MKYFVRMLVALPLLLVILVVGLVLAFNSGMFHSFIQQKAGEAAGAETKLNLGAMKLGFSWPPHLKIGSSSVDHPAAQVEWKQVEIELLKMSAPYFVRVDVLQPRVTLKPAPSSATKASTPTAQNGGPSSPPSLGLRLRVVDGQVGTGAVEIKKLNVEFEQKLLLQSVASLHLTAGLRAKVLPAEIPLKVDSDQLTLTMPSIKAQDLKMSLAGLEAALQGESRLNEGAHQWSAEIRADDLSKLPAPPPEVPVEKWTGAVRLKADVRKAAGDPGFQVSGHFQLKEVAAAVNYKQDKLIFRGPLKAEGEGQFAYANGAAALPALKAFVDLSAAQVTYQDMLDKPAGVALRVNARAVGDQQKVKLEELRAEFWNFAASAAGEAELKAPFNGALSFQLKPAALNGAEKILLPLKSSPVKGEISLAGTIGGPLTEPMKSRIVIQSFALKNFSGVVQYESGEVVKLRGPVTADIQGRAEIVNGRVRSAEGAGEADLSAPAMVAGPLRKEANQRLVAKFKVRNQQNSVLIDAMDLSGFLGALSTKGKVDLAAIPQVDVTVEARPLSLSELRIAMPSMRDLIPKGSLGARVQIRGKLETTKPWQDWPLTVVGSVDARLPEYKMAAAKPATAPQASAPNAAPAPPTSFLPDGELTRKLRMNVKAQIDQFVKEPLIAKNVGADGLIANGRFTGKVTVGQVFDGGAQVTDLNVPLLQVNPRIRGQARWQAITIEEALGFAKPEYKTFASGKTTGHADFATLMPDRPDFLTQLTAKGEILAQPVTFNTVKVGDMINEQIKKIPQLNLKPAKVEPLKGQARARYELQNGVAELAEFTGTDTDGSEVQMRGKVVLANMHGDFAGKFFWSDPPVKGCALEGNADGQGRMVVPLAIKGNLMQPGFSLLSDVISKLASKTVECEGKKLLDRVKKEGTKQLEKEIQKGLKGIFGK